MVAQTASAGDSFGGIEYTWKSKADHRYAGSVWNALMLCFAASYRSFNALSKSSITASCTALFKREDVFFVGAILANMVVTELVVVTTYMVWLLISGIGEQSMLIIPFLVALLFPIAFYHHSWSFWLGFDNLVESLPKYVKRD